MRSVDELHRLNAMETEKRALLDQAYRVMQRLIAINEEFQKLSNDHAVAVGYALCALQQLQRDATELFNKANLLWNSRDCSEDADA